MPYKCMLVIYSRLPEHFIQVPGPVQNKFCTSEASTHSLAVTTDIEPSPMFSHVLKHS